VTRNLYIAAIAVTLTFTALYTSVIASREIPAAVIHVFADFKVLWICAAVALWQLVSDSNQSLRWSDVIWGSAIAILAAPASGLWPWLLLSAFAARQLQGEKRQQTRQALYLLLAIGLHEAVIRVCGDVFGDTLLGIDAAIAAFLTSWSLPGIQANGTTLQVVDGHVVLLVWGCSSLSRIGEMMLLCWALALFLLRDSGLCGIRGCSAVFGFGLHWLHC
jgi:hypothetical protein